MDENRWSWLCLILCGIAASVLVAFLYLLHFAPKSKTTLVLGFVMLLLIIGIKFLRYGELHGYGVPKDHPLWRTFAVIMPMLIPAIVVYGQLHPKEHFLAAIALAMQITGVCVAFILAAKLHRNPWGWAIASLFFAQLPNLVLSIQPEEGQPEEV